MIISFYSYKGGVGRTQLLANLAAYLCYYKQRKVLLMDWDFEAPGLPSYFSDYFNKKNKRKRPQKGVIEYLNRYVDLMREADTMSVEDIPPLKEMDIHPVIKTSHEGRVDLILAGDQSNPREYIKKIVNFNWKELYEDLDGSTYLEHFKTQLKALDYDYIFIDSRTGFSDYSGACNIQMADANVIVVAPNKQNFDGALQMADIIINSPYTKDGNFRQPLVFPLLSRIKIDSFAPDSDSKPKEFRKIFEFLIDKINQNRPWLLQKESYFKQAIIPYNKFIEIGENMVFNEKAESTSENTFEAILANIADNIIELNHSNSEIIFTIALEHEKNHDYQNAIKLLEEMVYKGTQEIKVPLKLASLYRKTRNLDKAIGQLERIVIYDKLHRNNPEARKLLATCYRENQQIDKSIEVLETWINYSPDQKNIEIQKELAVDLRETGKIEESIALLNRIILHEDASQITSDVYNQLAISYLYNNQVQEALDILQKIK